MLHMMSAFPRSLYTSALLLSAFVLLLAVAQPASAQITWAIVSYNENVFCGTVNLVTGHWNLIYQYDRAVAGLGTYANNIYGGAGNALLQVNPTSCTEILVGQSSENLSYAVFGSTTGASPALYGAGSSGGHVYLYLVHANDGSTVRIGDFNLIGPTSMSSNCPALYATATQSNGNSALFSVNTNTGATTEIGDTGVVDITAMVCQDGNLYAARNNGLLCTLNLTNGLANCPGFTSRAIVGMAYPPNSPPAFSVLHSFTGGADGAQPWAGLILDPAGNLYGTAAAGGTGSCAYLGASGCGTIFQLKKHDTSYTFNPLYSFQGDTDDGEFPARPLTRGPNGTYYGATTSGGEGSCSFYAVPGCGVVFNAGPAAQPPRTPLLEFRESVLYHFTGGSDGGNPFSTVVFDQAGNIYGTTVGGGANGLGTVFELTPAGGGTYAETVLYSFVGGSDGANPYDGVTFDTAGNLYGTTLYGGGSTVCQTGCGTVFKLSPSGGGWTETVIYRFQGSSSDGQYPTAGVVIDGAGNLYGNTNPPTLGQGGNGANYVYELSPNGSSWTYNRLFAMGGGFGYGRVALDSNGNLYATTEGGGAFGFGQVSKLALGSGIFTSLYNFTNGTDGANPYSGVVVDSSGTVYGTTIYGGGVGCHDGCGVVWEITQSTN